eukprot:6187851-Pleurochrysis_carterae.AAC.1
MERSGSNKVHSVLLDAIQVKQLCCFQAVCNSGMGLDHVRIVSCQGDLRFVRSLEVKSVQSVTGSNARSCAARLEVVMSVWEVNGFSCRVDTGPQLRFSPAQW